MTASLLVAALTGVVPGSSVAPVAADPADFTEFPIPTADSGPTGIITGPDGALWFTENSANKIGRIAVDGTVTEFPIPTEASGPTGIAAGPDGALWFTESAANKIGRITTAGAITEFPVPTEASAPLDITTGPDGNLWFTENAAIQIGRLAPGTGVFTEFGVDGFGPAGITAGPDGNLWFTDFVPTGFFSGSVRRMTPAGESETFPLSISEANPTDITAGPDGNLWVAESGIAHVARVTPAGEVTQFGVPGGTTPLAIAAGPDGNLWFTAPDANRVGRMTVEGAVAEFAVPTASATPTGIATGPDGKVWFTEPGANQVANVVTTATPLPAVRGLSPASGPSTGGTVVTVSGIGFSNASAVRFGGTDASGFSVVDDATVTATAPALPGGRYDVTVTTPEGTSGITELDLYASLAPLTVTALAPDESDPVGGIQVTILGSGFTTATSVRFGDLEASFDINTDSQITVTSVPPHEGDGIVDVIVTAEQGMSAVSGASKFTYLARPVITGVVPRYGPAVGGTIVVINGSRFTDATSVTFGDLVVPCPAKCTIVNDNQLAVVSPPHAPEGVDLVVTNPSAPSVGNTRFAFYGVGAFRQSGGCVRETGCLSRSAALLPDGRVLEIGGGFRIAAQLYDPRTEMWTSTTECLGCPNFGGPMTVLPAGPASVCGDNCGKVLLSDRGLATLYDPATNVWEPTTDPNLPRVGSRAVLLRSGKVLVVGGVNGPSEVFDPVTESWSLTGSFSDSAVRVGVGATLLPDGRVLATGGFRGGTNGARDTAQIFDPNAIDPSSSLLGAWTVVEPMHTARYFHSATLLPGGKVMVVGGELRPTGALEEHHTNAVEIFDPATGHWSDVAPMTFRRGPHAAALLPSGKLLVAGGDFVDPTTVAELFDPVSGSWTPAAPAMPIGPEGLGAVTAVALPQGPLSSCGSNCGRVLVMKGSRVDGTDPKALPWSMLYDPRPELASVSPAGGPAAGGTTVTLTGTGLAGASSVTFGGAAATALTPDPASPDTRLTVVAPSHASGAVDVVVATGGGTATRPFTYQAAAVVPTTSTPTTPAPGPTSPAATLPVRADQGYALVGADGGVFSFGALPFLGSLGALSLNRPVVAMEYTPSGRGYWLVGADGGVFAFGDAKFLGSTGAIRLAQPIVAMRSTTSGNGYWLVGADGGVFAFGDARFVGSTGAIRLAQPVVGMDRSASGNGYWLVGADGGIFAFGDAVYHGSTGALRLNSPIVGLASAPAGSGYWLCARDGGVFAFGSAQFRGSMGAARLNQPVVACAAPRALPL